MRLCVHVIPVYSVDVPAVSGVVSVLIGEHNSTETTPLTAGTSTEQTGIS